MTTGVTTHKFTLALNKSADESTLMEAATLAALGLSASASQEIREQMRFLKFVDADGGVHPFISALSLIVMRGKAGELRKFREEATRAGLSAVAITRAMCNTAPEERASKVKGDTTSEFLAVLVFGQKHEVEPLTKRMSLWK